MDDNTRWEEEENTAQFERIVEAIATETNRTRSLPDLTEAERMVIDERMSNLRVGVDALTDSISRIGERQTRAELFGQVAWLLSVAANLGLHDVSNPILKRQRQDQTSPGRSAALESKAPQSQRWTKIITEQFKNGLGNLFSKKDNSTTVVKAIRSDIERACKQADIKPPSDTTMRTRIDTLLKMT